MSYTNGDIIIVDNKPFRIEGTQLVPEENYSASVKVSLKDLRDSPGQEFVIYGNTGVQQDKDNPLAVVYLGTKDLKQRYYHELNQNTVVEIKKGSKT